LVSTDLSRVYEVEISDPLKLTDFPFIVAVLQRVIIPELAKKFSEAGGPLPCLQKAKVTGRGGP
jgi:hypothetical protein